MTRSKSYSNRKGANKITLYLPDDLRDFLRATAKGTGQTRSQVVQRALALLRDGE